MTAMELHIITVCAVLLAVEPARKAQRSLANWWHRHTVHREHLRRLEQENG